MALTSALFTGLSGLDVNQQRLNVVGNNIANVNTVAFKSSRALFKPQFYVTDGAGSPPSASFGGTNPNQRGLGATVAAIDKDWAPGSIQPTGKATDMAIDGEGFFVLQGTAQRFTRDGSFSLNSANQLVTTDGQFVQGYGVDLEGNVIPGNLQNVTIPLGTTTAAQPTANMTLQGNLNISGPVAGGASILNSQDLTTLGGAAAPTAATLLTDLASPAANGTPLMTAGDVFTLKGTKGGREMPARSFTVTAASTVQDLSSFYEQAMGIDATVPDDNNPATPAPGATIRADPATPNTAKLVITGNLGKDNSLALNGSAFSDANGATPFSFSDGTDAAGIASNASGESVHTSAVVYDSLGSPITVDVTAVLESKADTGNTWRVYANSGDNAGASTIVGSGILTFDGAGKLKTSTGDTFNIDRAGTGAKSPLTVKVDFSSLSSLASQNSSLVMTKQDGSQIGTLDNFEVGADGKITGSFTNGLSRTLGQVAVATFSNNQGLVDLGANNYVAGGDSGLPIISTPLDLGAGSIRAGSLEQSNVDLSKEFVNLIISSTGFSAASRVISTSDQLITDLLNSSH